MTISHLNLDGIIQWLKRLTALSKGHYNHCWDTGSSKARTNKEKSKINLSVSNTYFGGYEPHAYHMSMCCM